MSAAYSIGGALVGAAIARMGPGETAWALLFIPAAICFATAWTNEPKNRGAS